MHGNSRIFYQNTQKDAKMYRFLFLIGGKLGIGESPLLIFYENFRYFFVTKLQNSVFMVHNFDYPRKSLVEIGSAVQPIKMMPKHSFLWI